jgi:dUTP pyrophosphatase
MYFEYSKTISQPDLIRAHPTDAGIDLRAMELIKETDTIVVYDTGIIVRPPSGYYFDVVARSSLFKKGYMLGNAVGIVDPDYQGTIKLFLYKLGHAVPLELGERVCQMVIRQAHCFYPREVSPDVITSVPTKRGTGGFGSTGNN